MEAAERVEMAQRAEKAEERAAFLAAINSMTQVAVEAARASQAQAHTLDTFLKSFDVGTPPVAREWDPEAHDQRYLAKHYPEYLQGLGQIEQYRELIDKLNSGE